MAKRKPTMKEIRKIVHRNCYGEDGMVFNHSGGYMFSLGDMKREYPAGTLFDCVLTITPKVPTHRA